MQCPSPICWRLNTLSLLSLLTFPILFMLLKNSQCSITLSSLRAIEATRLPGNIKEEDEKLIIRSETKKEEEFSLVTLVREKHDHQKKEKINTRKDRCNIFDGRWVYDPKTSPLYHWQQCPYLSPQVSCQKNGRPDSNYERWRWKPRDCHIPRFNGTDLLERWRGKRVIIVGDSLNRNQWESLSCLLHSAVSVSPTQAQLRQGGHHNRFHAKGYNCTVEFFWNPFLVQLDNRKGKENRATRVLRLDTISSQAPRWLNADVMIFNSGHWWLLGRWDLLEFKGKVVEMEAAVAFKRAIKTWARWIDKNIDPNKTSIFFRTLSPVHAACYKHTKPAVGMEDGKNLYMKPNTKRIIMIAERVAAKMKVRVNYLNITRLSGYRREAHPTVYTTGQENQASVGADCGHWCLPGVPDTWNALLYAATLGIGNLEIDRIDFKAP